MIKKTGGGLQKNKYLRVLPYKRKNVKFTMNLVER